jgi:hypothetical protein
MAPPNREAGWAILAYLSRTPPYTTGHPFTVPERTQCTHSQRGNYGLLRAGGWHLVRQSTVAEGQSAPNFARFHGPEEHSSGWDKPERPE